MPEERRITVAQGLARISPDEITSRTFPTARKGFDPSEVRSYLAQLAREIQAAIDREVDLRAALARAEDLAANPSVDEATLTSALGHETARVLRSAHEAAAEISARASAEADALQSRASTRADELISRATAEAAALAEKSQAAAAEKMAAAEAAAAELRRRAEHEAAAMLDSARIEAEELLSSTRSECRSMLQEAQDLRSKVLADLTTRRRELHAQIEQLRAGRQRLAQVIGEVRRSVERIGDDLERAENDSRSLPTTRKTAPAAQASPRVQGPSAVEEPGPSAVEEPGPSAVEEPGPSAVEEPGPSAVEEPGPSAVEEPRASVDELFARLRSAAPESVGSGSHPQASAVTEEDGTPAEDVGSAVDAAVTEEPGTPAEDVGSAVDAAVAPEPLFAKRDELLAPVVTDLSRRLKRALQDDQNDLLDRIRSSKAWEPGLLGEVRAHEARFAESAADQLRKAASSAGAYLEACGVPGGAVERGDSPRLDLDGQSVELARSIVSVLRRRIEQEAGRLAPDDDAIVEKVGSAYREWKGARIERLAEDSVVAAFSTGLLWRIPDSASIAWRVDPSTDACPDCADNALAGSLPRGEQFPTGHPHPPAHPGCRCLIVPAEA